MGLQTTQQRSFTAYAYAWLPPLRPDGFSSKGARTISVKFTVSDASGTLVQDQSVAVSLVDANANVVVGPVTFGNTPDSSVAFWVDTLFFAALFGGTWAAVRRVRRPAQPP